MADISKFQVVIGADINGLQKSLGKVQSSLSSFGKKATSIGKTMSMSLTAPLTGLGVLAVRNFNKQAQAIGQVETALNSTGGAVGRTSKELQGMASQLQSITTFGDEEILEGVTAQLLTFTNITTEQFDRTQKAALDLSTRLGTDLKSSSIQLGKALNDPIANLSALSRSGIQFSEEQKKVIKELANTNRLADAQTIILDELEKQYGGSAEAAAKLGTGPLKQLQNEFGDLLEDMGGLILEGLSPLIKILTSVVKWMRGLSGTTKTVIAVVAGVVASIGPMLFIFGKIVALLPVLKAGFAAVSVAVGGISLPVVAVVAGIAALTAAIVYAADNWDAIVERISDWSWWKNMLIDMAKFLVQYSPISLLIKGVNTALEYFNQATIPDPFANVADGLEKLKDKTKEYKNEFGSFSDAISNAAKGVKEFFNMGGADSSIKSPSSGGGTSANTPITSGNYSGTSGEPRVNTEISKINPSSGLQQESMLSQSIEMTKVDLDSLKEKMDEVTSDINAKQQEMAAVAMIVADATGDAFANLGHNVVNSLGLAEDGMQGFLRSFLSSAVEIIANALSISMANAILAASGAAAQTGIAAPVTMPVFLAQMTGAVIGAFAAIPKFANGGIVGGTQYSGDNIMARVNSGEMILNSGQQNQLFNMLNGGGTMGGDVHFRIQGSDLIGSIDRENRRRVASGV